MKEINLIHSPKLKKENKKLFSLKLAKKIVLSLILIFIFEFFLFPAPILAAEYNETANISDNSVNIDSLEAINNENSGEINKIVNNLPDNEDIKIVKSSYHSITAYNSDVSQCDGSPCITANGFNLCEHGIEDSVAANFLKFGTKIKIPDLYGDKVFVVRDRMNKRYSDRIDIWMKNKVDAKKFGVKIVKIEILSEP